MAKLLYIEASPRTGRSDSIAVAQAFLKAYRESHPKDQIVALNVFTADLPSFDGLAVQAKYTILHGHKHSQEELVAWRRVEEVIAGFKSADKYVMAVPMWNFGIPYRLKLYIDILVQPGYTFSYSPKEGYKGLLTGKRVFIVYARGGEYPVGTPGAAYDFQKPYLQTILGFIGLTDVQSVIVEPTLQAPPDVLEAKKKDAIARARQIAATF